MNTGRDTDWFVEQVRREQSRLRTFVRSLGVRTEAVDDIAQDAFVVAYERLAVFRDDEDFGAWVRGIARRLVANWLRKDNRRRVILSEHMSELLAASALEQLHPLAETVQGDRLAALQSCLEQLPDTGKQLVHLRYFEELSPGAIASRCDRSANDVRQHLFRLRRALLKCIGVRLGLATGGES